MSNFPTREFPRDAAIDLQSCDIFPADSPAQPGDSGDDTHSKRFRHESGRPLRILIVEDDPAVADVLEDMISSAGAQSVGVITSALAAVDAAAVISPDVVLLDVRLPGAMDSLEATRVIQARRSSSSPVPDPILSFAIA